MRRRALLAVGLHRDGLGSEHVSPRAKPAAEEMAEGRIEVAAGAEPPPTTARPTSPGGRGVWNPLGLCATQLRAALETLKTLKTS